MWYTANGFRTNRRTEGRVQSLSEKFRTQVKISFKHAVAGGVVVSNLFENDGGLTITVNG